MGARAHLEDAARLVQPDDVARERQRQRERSSPARVRQRRAPLAQCAAGRVAQKLEQELPQEAVRSCTAIAQNA